MRTIIPPPFRARIANVVRHAFDARDHYADADVYAARASLERARVEIERALAATHKQPLPSEFADTVKPPSKEHARRFGADDEARWRAEDELAGAL